MLLAERVERLALADRAAGLRDEDGQPPNVEDYVTSWAEWLEHDPDDTKEARDERRIREIMEAVA